MKFANDAEQTVTSTATFETTAATTVETTPPSPSAEASIWRELYEQQGRELAELKQVTAAARFNAAPPSADGNLKPSMTVERARAMAGPDAWFRMSEAQRLAAIGQDAGTIDRDYLRRIFGKGADGRLGQDLFKVSALKYRLAKEAAICIGVYCA